MEIAPTKETNCVTSQKLPIEEDPVTSKMKKCMTKLQKAKPASVKKKGKKFKHYLNSTLEGVAVITLSALSIVVILVAADVFRPRFSSPSSTH